jgi:carboxyl-terminal processing protease
MSPKIKTTKLIIYALCCIFFSKGDASDKNLYQKKHQLVNLSEKNLHPFFLAQEREKYLTIGIVVDLIHRYYVDRDKITNKLLLKQALNKISTHIPKWKIKKTRKKTLTLYSEEGKLKIKFDRSPSKYELIQYLLKIITAVEDYTDIEEPLKFVLNSMLMSLDSHSNYLSAKDYKFLIEETRGAFGGIGIVVGFRDHNLTVIKPIENSPAHKAGIEAMDYIIAINDTPTWGIELNDLVSIMRGQPGTDVKITILRQNELSTRDIYIKRQIIPVNSITSKHINSKGKNTLYIKVENFSSTTDSNIQKAMQEFNKKYKKIDTMIMDLRSNPGGLLDQAVSVSDLFLNDGIILSIKGHIEEIKYANDNGEDSWNFPMIVMIDSNSASASEIVAGALQDHGRALVLGQKSFGKGSVQTVFQIVKDRGLKMTIARYLTPHGYYIQAGGVVPNIYLLPVLDNEENNNFFGAFRYIKEGSQNGLFTKSQKVKTIKDIMYRSHYLLDIHDRDNKEKDPEIEIASSILHELSRGWKKVKKTPAKLKKFYTTTLKNTDHIKDQDQQARDFLREKGIVWKKAKIKQDHKGQIIIEKINWFIENINNEETKLVFNISLRNLLKKKINEISIYLQELENFGYFNETLIGSIAAGKRVTKSIKIDLPFSLSNKKQMLLFHIGLAFSGIADKKLSKKTLVHFKGRQPPKLSTSAILTAETNNPGILGVLEKQEKGKIKITVQNEGGEKIEDIFVSLRNLSGDQVMVSSIAKKIKTLLPGQKASVLIDVMAGNKILKERLTIGLKVEALHLPKTHFDTLQIKAQLHGKTR